MPDLLYTSPLGDIFKRHNLEFHFYADDTQLDLAFKSTAAEQPRNRLMDVA